PKMGEGKPRLLDPVRDWIRRKNYSIRTEEAYVDWIRRCARHATRGRQQRRRSQGQLLNVLAIPNSKVTRSARRIGALRRKKHA
ncbi:MAG: hypothetical protein ACREKR_14795, partial [Candidatus Methylomirabilales bacterium]